MTKGVDKFKRESIRRLGRISAEPLREYMELFSAATGLSKTHALTNVFEVTPETKENLRLLENYISQRCTGMPLPYITGIKGFWKKDFRVTIDTLIPRPETELLVELILTEHKRKNLKLLTTSPGTGSARSRREWEAEATS